MEKRNTKGTKKAHGFSVRVALVAMLVAGALAVPALAQPPTLPEGLDEDEERAVEDGPPRLPIGLEDDAPEPEVAEEEPGLAERFTERFTGFWDTRAGVRLQDDPNQRATSLAETRLQLSTDHHAGPAAFRVTADLLYDNVAGSGRPRLKRGEGMVDLREGFVDFPAGDYLDIRAGRQILTWGVGDLLFLNDLFPKDWNSFFAGRDEEYLKAPSDAIRLAAFTPAVNLDLVYTPRFDPDRYLDNRRLSFFDPLSGRIIGRDVAIDPIVPDAWFDDDEWALRAHRLVASWEVAGYAYRGFWKSPEGFDPASLRPTFPRLRAWGASLRGPLHTGILSVEASYYDSADDASGTDPFVPNSQFRFLAGYEQEIVPDLMLGGQYYLERTLDVGALKENLPEGVAAPDRYRHVLTTRLTLLTHAQNVTWSLFAFVSPSDVDGYLRGLWSWKATDAWTLSAGFNGFFGRDEDSFFGQFENNTNAYLALRFGF